MACSTEEKTPDSPEAAFKVAQDYEKADRYQTAEAFQHDLSTFLAAQYPSFNSSQLSNLLQLLFEEELVREGRPVKLPREFVERAQRWKKTPNPIDHDDAGWVDESDPEADGEAPTEMATMGHAPDEDDHIETRPLQLPPTVSLGEVPVARPLRASRSPAAVRKTVAFGAAAALFGFLGVFLIIKLTHGTINVRSTPAGALVMIDGQQLAQPTPVQVPNLRSGREYKIEVLAPGYLAWANDVPLKGGQHLEIDAKLQSLTRLIEAPVRPLPLPAPVAIAPPQMPKGPPPDVVTWPTSRFELDPIRHHIDLDSAGAGSLPLDPRRTYSVWLNKGPTLGWGFYVLNSAGSQAGALGQMPVLISGSSKLFAYRIPSVLLGGPMPEETKPRTLLVQMARSRTKNYTVAPTLKLGDPSGLLAQGLDPRATYEIVLHQSTPAKHVSHVVIGHPTLGLINTQFETPIRITGASRLWFTSIVTQAELDTERPVVEIKLKR